MCGINGMVFLNKVARDESMWTAIRYVFDELLVETQDRGHHATGLATFRRDGEWHEMYKAPKSAIDMATDDEFYEGIISRIGNSTSSIISHTRWYTKGKPEINNNNHPFDIGNVIGVHNGTVANDDQLFKQFGFDRVAEVDSEIIYQLINKYNEKKITYAGLKKALEKSYLRGVFALAFAHKNQPNLVHIVKQERPMDFVFWKEAGVLIFNSQKDFIYNAFAKLKRTGKRFGFTSDITLEEYVLKDDKYITIDANAESFETMISEPESLFIMSSVAKSTYNYSGTGFNGRGTTGTGTTTTNMRSITATDSIGRIIEGELDDISGEVIIFTSAQIAGVGEEDDGSGLTDEGIYCIECAIPLQEHEIHAAYNEGAKATSSYHCSKCQESALANVFQV